MRVAVSLALASIAAYAFSFAGDLLLGDLSGDYPGTAHLPIVTWSAISIVTLSSALFVARKRRLLAIPYFALGLLAALSGAVAANRRSLIVAALMLFHAYVVWRATRPIAS